MIGLYKNTKFVAIRCVFKAENAPKPFSAGAEGRGSAPDPAGGAYDAPPNPLVGWGLPLPLDAFRVSISDSCPPNEKIVPAPLRCNPFFDRFRLFHRLLLLRSFSLGSKVNLLVTQILSTLNCFCYHETDLRYSGHRILINVYFSFSFSYHSIWPHAVGHVYEYSSKILTMTVGLAD